MPVELRSEGKNIQKTGDLHLVLDGMTVPHETLVALGAITQNGEELYIALWGALAVPSTTFLLDISI